MVESVSQHTPEWKYLSQDWQTEIKRWARKKKKMFILALIGSSASSAFLVCERERKVA